MTTTPEWAIGIETGIASWRRIEPLSARDGWLAGYPYVDTFDAQNRAVTSELEDAVKMLEWLTRRHPGATFYAMPWWEKREAALRAADAADTEYAMREQRRAEEAALDAAADVASAETGATRPPEWLRTRER